MWAQTNIYGVIAAVKGGPYRTHTISHENGIPLLAEAHMFPDSLPLNLFCVYMYVSEKCDIAVLTDQSSGTYWLLQKLTVLPRFHTVYLNIYLNKPTRCSFLYVFILKFFVHSTCFEWPFLSSSGVRKLLYQQLCTNHANMPNCSVWRLVGVHGFLCCYSV